MNLNPVSGNGSDASGNLSVDKLIDWLGRVRQSETDATAGRSAA